MDQWTIIKFINPLEMIMIQLKKNNVAICTTPLDNDGKEAKIINELKFPLDVSDNKKQWENLAKLNKYKRTIIFMDVLLSYLPTGGLQTKRWSQDIEKNYGLCQIERDNAMEEFVEKQ